MGAVYSDRQVSCRIAASGGPATGCVESFTYRALNVAASLPPRTTAKVRDALVIAMRAYGDVAAMAHYRKLRLGSYGRGGVAATEAAALMREWGLLE